jgi:hypothetical protein
MVPSIAGETVMPRIDIELSEEQIQFLTTVATNSQYQHVDRLVGELVSQFKYSFETTPRSGRRHIVFPSTGLPDSIFAEASEAGTNKQDTGSDVVIYMIGVQVALSSIDAAPAYSRGHENG